MALQPVRKISAKREIENTLVAFLTARGEDYSQIAGFEAGGDDYITKPIKPKVLISRIKALLKRRSVKLHSMTELKYCFRRPGHRQGALPGDEKGKGYYFPGKSLNFCRC